MIQCLEIVARSQMATTADELWAAAESLADRITGLDKPEDTQEASDWMMDRYGGEQ
jgi:hypothetical protein